MEANAYPSPQVKSCLLAFKLSDMIFGLGAGYVTHYVSQHSPPNHNLPTYVFKQHEGAKIEIY